jgi:hypothetical protein
MRISDWSSDVCSSDLISNLLLGSVLQSSGAIPIIEIYSCLLIPILMAPILVGPSAANAPQEVTKIAKSVIFFILFSLRIKIPDWFRFSYQLRFQ